WAAGGIGADGRITFPVGTLPVAERARLATESVLFGSASLGSALSASAGRGRGSRLAIVAVLTTGAANDPNIGAGCGPAWRNSALVMMAVVAAKASRPATTSF